MQHECPSCHHLVEFSAEPPAFCAYCGLPIGKAQGGKTIDFDSQAATTPPADPSAYTQGAIPEFVGGYRLLRPLGSGGMGTVYEAADLSSGSHVAVKLISAEFATSKEAVDRFRQEGRLASAIVHPRCVFVFAADEHAGQPYIAMELMPGVTLQDLVKQRGPLPTEEAVAKIMDVIDGLQEVHRLGIIHRDIKPSNCYLEADGRVKIGDFGLSKSLIRDAQLTKVGVFLGTPLYASPEQIKMERVDQRSDVYAVAATLYFLLTGRAPHQTGDATATLARIVSDPVPSLRSIRPRLPAALDRVVLRGLERDRKHRWKSLEEFRGALSSFVRRQLSIGGVRLRVWAYLLDLLLLTLVLVLVSVLLASFDSTDSMLGEVAATIAHDVLWIAYFAFLEGIWGCSLGKRLLRLRVCSEVNGAQLGVSRALLRTFIFYVLANLGWLIAAFLKPGDVAPYETEVRFRPGLWIQLLPVIWLIVGIVALASTMRKRNGYRALHDFLSGSRVVQLPWPARRRKWREQAQEQGVFRTDGLPERIDQFTTKGALRWTAEEGMLLAEDLILDRKVWLWLRPQDATPLTEARRAIARPARLRWLDGGQNGDRQWDAFLAAPAGWSLPKLIAREQQLSWTETRPFLEQLIEELVAASRDGTMPELLTPEQVWVQPDGRVLLLDTPVGEFRPPAPDGVEVDVHQRGLSLLREVAVLALEGRPRLTAECPRPMRTPAPEHAARMLDKLLGVTDSYQRVEEFQADLSASLHLPTQVTRGLRAQHLAVEGLAVMAGGTTLVGLVALLVILIEPALGPRIVQPTPAVFTWATFSVACAFLLRGGLTLSMTGIVLAGADGRRASRWRCAWRALLVWLPVMALAFWEAWANLAEDAAIGFLISPIILYLTLALAWPRRGLHDRLAGTYLVPK